MKKILLTICAAITVTSLIACANENNATAAPTTADSNNATTPTTESSSLETSLNNTAAPQEGTIAPQTPPAKTGAGLNPEHGQPGHRCDIEVGAPLNSAPAAQAPQMQAAPQMQVAPQTQAAPQMQMQAPPAQKTAPGFSGKANPEHGQPGHRCDLEVGVILP